MRRDVVLPERQGLAGGDPQLLLDQVEAGDELGDRVLHLQAGVHLHEERLVGRVRRDDELDRARTRVADRAGGVDGDLPVARTVVRGQQGGRRLLHHLLVAALQRALALAEVQHGAVRVGEHLHLDVPGPQDEALQEQGVVAEARRRLAPGADERLAQVARGVHQAHALAAAARARLHQHRVADLLGRVDQVVVGHPEVGAPGHDGDAGGADRLLGPDLVAHDLDGVGGRADEDQAGVGAGLREGGVLGEEAVAGVHGLRPGLRGGVEQPLDRQVALARRCRAEPHGDVGLPDVARAGVGVAVDADAADAEPAQGAHDADGDLAAVGDEDGVEHLLHILNTP